MALATLCPHCGTMFRVASDQLKLRGGIVRCGACQEIFDGSAALVDLDALAARAPLQAAAPAAPEVADVVEAPVAPEIPAGAEVHEAPEAFEAPEALEALEALTEADLPAAVAPESEPESEPADEPDAAPDTPAAPAQETPSEPVAVDAEDPVAPDLPVDTAAPDFDEQPVYTLDFDHTFDPFGILPKVAAPEEDAVPEPAAEPEAQPLHEDEPVTDVTVVEALSPDDTEPAAPSEPEAAATGDTPQELAPPAFAPAAEISFPPSGRIEPSFDLPVDEEIVAAALPGHDHGHDQEREPAAKAAHAADAPSILPLREAAGAIIHGAAPAPSAPPLARTPSTKRADKAAARRSRLTPTKIDAPPKIRVPESDEPDFVKRSRQQEQSGRTRKIAMLAGSIALLLVLLLQGAFTFRNALAARVPAAKPALVSGCALFGCRVELPAQVDNLVIDSGELTTLGGGAYAFTTQLRNQGAVAQAWPSLELSLTDANDKPLVRRVFAPRDYLAASTPAANGLAPRVEQAITLHFRVDDLQPSGYHIAVFYP